MSRLGMSSNSWPLVVKKINPGGTISWMVDCGMVNGKRIRHIFKIKRDAETKALQLKIERKNEGLSSQTLLPVDRVDAEYALSLLKPHGLTLRAAAEFFIRHIKTVKSDVKIKVLISEILENKEKDGSSPRYLKDLRTRLNIFAKSFPDQSLIDFSTSQVDDWLREIKHGATTRNNYRRILGVMFAYALKRGYILENPMINTSKAKEVEKAPGILTVTQAQKLLEKSEPDILPAIALGLFAGLRPESEIWRLDWSAIDFKSKLIDIAADKTKTAQKRFVKISDNLLAWLKPHHKKSGPVSMTGDAYFTRLQKARKSACIDNWPADCLRHTFGSMHYAQHKNIGDISCSRIDGRPMVNPSLLIPVIICPCF